MVVISDHSGASTYVSVHGASIEFPEKLLRRFFGQFGKVVNVRMNVFSAGRLRGVHDGIWALELRL